MSRLRAALPALLLALASPLAAQEILTNETIVKLLAAGLDQATVIEKVKTTKGNYDLSTDQLIALKQKGVPGPVIAAMLTSTQPVAAVAAAPEFSPDSPDPKAPHYPGVYVLNLNPGDGKMTRINATASNQAKTGGLLGYAFTMGIASLSIKATIPLPTAKVRTANPRPVFYFFFDESVPRALQGNGSTTWGGNGGQITTSPSELSLVKFTEKPNAREARVGSANIAGAKTGVMDKDRLGFSADVVAPGVFKVVPDTDLIPGEYGFIQPIPGAGTSGAMTAKVFDFAVTR